MRLCFLRKNKTLGAIFRQASVLALLEANAATVAALQTGQPTAVQHDGFLNDTNTVEATDADMMDEDMTDAGDEPTQLKVKKHKIGRAHV